MNNYWVNMISSTGGISAWLGAAPVGWWKKSKNPTPVTCTGTLTVGNEVEDRLYVSNLPVEIDEDVREEDWAEIRKQPEHKRKARV